ARADVRPVHVLHELRLPQVQLVVAAVDEDALLVEHRAHGAVEEVRAAIGEQVMQSHRYSLLGPGRGRGRGRGLGARSLRSRASIPVTRRVSLPATFRSFVLPESTSSAARIPITWRTSIHAAHSAVDRRAMR